jgi:hypothetical protein
MRYIRVFWPGLLYAASFALYGLAVSDFYGAQGTGSLMTFYLPCLIANFAVLPGVALGQMGYGVHQTVKTKRREGRWHIYSSLVVFGLSLGFLVFVSAGNYATV